ncbi:MAG: HAMP domain-containing sensor histidine kinase [Thermodesulfobacteriota bacterium]
MNAARTFWLSRLDPRRSLRVRLGWVFALAVAAPLTITTLAGMAIQQQRLEQSVLDGNQAALADASNILTQRSREAEALANLLAGLADIRSLDPETVQVFLDNHKDLWFLGLAEVFGPDRVLLGRSPQSPDMEPFACRSDGPDLARPYDLDLGSDFVALPAGLALRAFSPILDPATLRVRGVVAVTFPLSVHLLQAVKVRIKADVTLQWTPEGRIVSTLTDEAGRALEKAWWRDPTGVFAGDQARLSETAPLPGRTLATASEPLRDNTGRTLAVLAVSTDFADIAQSGRNTLGLILVASVLAFVVAAALGLLIAASFTRPISQLAGAIRVMSLGRLDSRAHLNREDELGHLAQAFNDMADALERRTASLSSYAAELAEANVRLQELDRMKSDFISTVSHELRTPLTSVRGFAKVIRRDFPICSGETKKPDEVRIERCKRTSSNLDIIIEESERLTRLINDILDVSKIESGAMQWRDQPLSLEEAVRRALDKAAGLTSAESGPVLATRLERDLPWVRMDPDRLMQVLFNLLSNALKFTPAGSVTVGAGRTPEGGVRLWVEDTGAGIPPEELDKVFNLFHQARNGSLPETKPQGTGLGLAIVQRIVEHYGGRTWAESTPGQGSTFIVELPAAAVLHAAG